MDINISLNQGKKFNQYQSKIKNTIEKKDHLFNSNSNNKYIKTKPDFKEGFLNLFQDNAKEVASVNVENTTEYMELQRLKSQFDSIIQQYLDLEQSSSNSMTQLLARYEEDNPYRGKNVILTGPGAIGYVTDMGTYKYYGTPDSVATTVGKNGCPADTSTGQLTYTYVDVASSNFNIPGSTIDSSPTLGVGNPMVTGQSCGSEGKNVYVNRLISNPTSTYVGCYNDKPAATQMNIVPVMNSTNLVNGFYSGASSVYENNNDFAGPWCAFDQNVNTWWHSELVDGFLYDGYTGLYLGNTYLNYYGPSGPATVKGEWLQINMPNLDKTAVLTSYTIQGRQDCCGNPNGRDPNTWYIFGLSDDPAGWTQIDYQENQEFNYQAKTYTISNPQPWAGFAILTTVCGSSGDKSGQRICVQIASWNLFTSSNYSINDSERAMTMTLSGGFTTLDACQKYAGENGYQYFGMQDVQPDGTAQCLVSNDITKSQSYGDASKIVTGISIWQTGARGNNTAALTTAGQLVVTDIGNNDIIWATDNAPADCLRGGIINTDGFTATYGANCNNSGYSVAINNEYDTVMNEIKANNYPATLSIPINNSYFGDPAKGCPKSWDTYYMCGNKPKTAHIDYAEGQTFVYDCTDVANTCNFFLILQDDGNMCLYRGTSPMDNQGTIWCSQTNGQQKEPNPDWVATKGKNGLNYLTTGQGLQPGEWIGSSDGSLMLIMQTDGNLALWTSSSKSGCSAGTDGKQYGGPLVNAIYKLDTVGNPASMGKVGYVDADANLKEYPSSMIGQSNDYDIYNGYDSGGNDIASFKSQDMTGCQTACNINNNCFGYVWQPDYTTCYLKNNNIYPTGQRQPNSTLTLGVKKPSINGTSCSDEMIGIDSVQYDNYIKGDNMSSDIRCDGNITNEVNQNGLANLEKQLADISQQIADKVNKLSTNNTNANNTMTSEKEKMNDNLKMYYEVQKKMKFILDKNSKIKKDNIKNNNMVEGMVNMQDLNAMLSDSDLVVLQNNYQYILWSILAIGIVGVTIKTLKK